MPWQNLKKREDIFIIKELILSNLWESSGLTFRLMKEYPNEEYLEIYERYYSKYFYRKICKVSPEADDFINSIAVYKNGRSERILNDILNRKPFLPCSMDSQYLYREVAYAIWGNPCDEYLKIRKQIENYVINEEKNKITIPAEQTEIWKDTSSEPIRWILY